MYKSLQKHTLPHPPPQPLHELTNYVPKHTHVPLHQHQIDDVGLLLALLGGITLPITKLINLIKLLLRHVLRPLCTPWRLQRQLLLLLVLVDVNKKLQKYLPQKFFYDLIIITHSLIHYCSAFHPEVTLTLVLPLKLQLLQLLHH